MYKLEVDGRPVPKKRPRVTKSHTYTPSEIVQYENKVLANWVAVHGNVELEGDLRVKLEFHYGDKRTGDIDNLVKAPLDALGGGGDGYRPFNDRQVKDLQASIIAPVEDEKTVIEIEKT